MRSNGCPARGPLLGRPPFARMSAIRAWSQGLAEVAVESDIGRASQVTVACATNARQSRAGLDSAPRDELRKELPKVVGLAGVAEARQAPGDLDRMEQGIVAVAHRGPENAL